MNDEKTTNFLHDHFIAIMCSVFVAVLFACMLCVGKGVRDNGDGASNPGSAINAARQEQQNITAGVAGAEGKADQLANDLQGATEAADRITGTIADSGDAIRDCQQIITAVRKRGPLKTASY